MDPLVIALGGNALLKKGEQPTYRVQMANVRKSVKPIVKALAKSKDPFVITHGNGPQVGEEFLRNIHARQIPRMPLYLLNAETQAVIGSMIEQAIREELERLRSKKQVVTIITHVLVDKDDAAFKRPTKPIGPFYTRAQLKKELIAERFPYTKEQGLFRRVVPSPKPIKILELEAIKEQTSSGVSVICCGGGGIPMARNGTGSYSGVNAVLDKDRTTSLLASSLGAKRIIILTDIDHVIDPKTRMPIELISVEQARQRLDKFEVGTMKPKVEACVSFMEKGGEDARIGSLSQFSDVLRGKCTRMPPDAT